MQGRGCRCLKTLRWVGQPRCNMVNLKEAILYVNIKGKNGMREVREARFTKMCAEPYDISLTRDDTVSSFIEASFDIEVAGLGEIDTLKLRELDGGLYCTEEDALCKRNEIYECRYGDTSLNLQWAKIKLSDLNFKHRKMSVSIPVRNTCRPFCVSSWYWDGTRAVKENVDNKGKFLYDFLENRIVEFENEKIDRLGTLYATSEACRQDNTPKVVRFGKQPKPCEMVVRFEITRKVAIPCDCVDDERDTILRAFRAITDDEIVGSCEYSQI